MHSKVIKSHQCSEERSHVVLILILNSDQGLALFRQKQILVERSHVVLILILNSDEGLAFLDKNRSLQVYYSQNFTKIMKIFLFSCSMLGYI